MRIVKRIGKYALILLGLLVLAYLVLIVVRRPSLTRDWAPDQAVLATVEFSAGGDLVQITNIRNIDYRSTTDYDIRYYDKTYDLSKLESVWYMVEPFAGYGAGAAHTLVSFGFEGGDYVAISAEIRKEKGEAFSAVKGLLRQYELVYVIADEQDVIKLRSNYRKDDVFLYPVITSKENMRKLFVSMLERANELATKPEFYNTLTSTCTTNIVSHVNEIVPGRIPFSLKVLMPAYSDELAHDIGLIDNSVSLEELRQKYRINERAEQYADAPDWSVKIRQAK
ncbi:MAG: hypothetical protein COU11_03825 [Candidatus Harrisonbacteria bacterium CG10_big_fil_rev_8_21_14_0_10_49_15]|uniref:Lnb N-terminal periplasmic domain-containing protein n=1 Tax=Candidatus Harrisonbacteria bacterium CG10_big_fil_rev_8_21_14_0_10_49_15 TaxID=1974587 RepID=A0A2H0UMA1_9BACT|nr:MAG: hypothetical protein COU11_03825 [Candidatus Harrisonbacteria bacterium CG10_big_fil_rev_8_21_14_0_10_49_15]